MGRGRIVYERFFHSQITKPIARRFQFRNKLFAKMARIFQESCRHRNNSTWRPNHKERRSIANLKELECSADVERAKRKRRIVMDGIIYLVGLIVVVMAILSFLGLR